MRRCVRVKKIVQKRTHRMVLTQNDDEMQALEYYTKKYRRGTQTRSSLIRQILMTEVIQRCESDSMMLFKEEEMR